MVRRGSSGRSPLSREQTLVLTVFIKHGKDFKHMATALSKVRKQPVSSGAADEVFQTALALLGGNRKDPVELVAAAQEKKWLPKGPGRRTSRNKR